MIVPFDPITALAGGALIGTAATLLVFVSGRVAGVAGILGEAIAIANTERGWRIAFLAGLVAAPLALAEVGRAMPLPELPTNWAVVIGAGLLVGIGTRLAGGCTSGHGICGNARLSPRSIVATLVFVLTGMVVVTAVRHGLGA